MHPLASLYSHQENLAILVDEAILHLPAQGSTSEGPTSHGTSLLNGRKLPDFISVTRGPGMRSNLFTGIDTAKGLAAAWQIDLVGVHHMQAHALTPRLVSALQNKQPDADSSSHMNSSELPSINVEPAFPFLSILASGGHTLLIRSSSLTEHEIMGSTIDVAVGDMLDKAARIVLPSDILQNAKTTMYGALLERFAFPEAENFQPTAATEMAEKTSSAQPEFSLEDNTASTYQALYASRYAYVVPKNREEALKRNVTKWGWSINAPLAKAGGGTKNNSLEMSFSGLNSAIERIARFQWDPVKGKPSNTLERASDEVGTEERKAIACESMRAAFEHVASRVVLGLQQSPPEADGNTKAPTVVMSGGVAANSYFRFILASMLVAHGYPDARIVFPPPSLCTDNAAMIAWAGIEMYQAGFKHPRSIRGIRKWPLDQLLSPPTEDAL